MRRVQGEQVGQVTPSPFGSQRPCYRLYLAPNSDAHAISLFGLGKQFTVSEYAGLHALISGIGFLLSAVGWIAKHWLP